MQLYATNAVVINSKAKSDLTILCDRKTNNEDCCVLNCWARLALKIIFTIYNYFLTTFHFSIEDRIRQYYFCSTSIHV